MQIPEGSPITQFTVAEVQANIPMPFAAGFVCGKPEADVLNQVVVENVRNNLREEVKRLKAENPGTDISAAVQKLVDEYVTSYTFGAHRTGPRLDPVESQALDLAVGIVKRKAMEKGEKVSELGMPELKERARKLLDDPVIGERFRERARAIVEASQIDL
jgi:hypothetical protein